MQSAAVATPTEEVTVVNISYSVAEVAELIPQLVHALSHALPAGTDITLELIAAAFVVHIQGELKGRLRAMHHIDLLPSFTWELGSTDIRSAYNVVPQYKWQLARRDGGALAGPTDDQVYSARHITPFTDLKLDLCLSETRAAACLVDYATCLANDLPGQPNGEATLLCHRIAALRDLTRGPPAFRAALALELPDAPHLQLYRHAWEEMQRAEAAGRVEVLAGLKRDMDRTLDYSLLALTLGTCWTASALTLRQYLAWSWPCYTLAGAALSLPLVDFLDNQLCRRGNAKSDGVRERIRKLSKLGMSYMQNEVRTSEIKLSICADEQRYTYEHLLLAAEYRRDIDDTERCAICLEDFALLDRVTPLPGCVHTFHTQCLRGLQTPECPLCRRAFFDVKEGGDDVAPAPTLTNAPSLNTPPA